MAVEPVSQDVERLRRRAADEQLDRLAAEDQNANPQPADVENAFREALAPMPVYARVPKEDQPAATKEAVADWRGELQSVGVLVVGSAKAPPSFVPQGAITEEQGVRLHTAMKAWQAGMDAPMREIARMATETNDENLSWAVGHFLPTNVPFKTLHDTDKARVAVFFNDQLLYESMNESGLTDAEKSERLEQIHKERDAYSASPYGEGAAEWANEQAKSYERGMPPEISRVLALVPFGKAFEAGLTGEPSAEMFFDVALAAAPLRALGTGRALKTFGAQEFARVGMGEVGPAVQGGLENLGAPHAIGVTSNLLIMFGTGAIAGGASKEVARAFTNGFLPMYPQLAETIMDDQIPWEDRAAAGIMFGLPLAGYGSAVLARGIQAGTNTLARFRSGEYQIRSGRIPDAYIATEKTPWEMHGTSVQREIGVLTEGPNTPGFWTTRNQQRALGHGPALIEARPAPGSRVLKDGPAAEYIFHEAAVRIEQERALMREQGLQMTTRRMDEIYSEVIREHGFDVVQSAENTYFANTARVEFRDPRGRPVTGETVLGALQTRIAEIARTATKEELPADAGGQNESSALGRLDPIETKVAEVQTSNNFIVRQLSRVINPAVLRTTLLGKMLVGYARQLVARDELTKVALAIAYDSHAQRWTGRLGHIWQVDAQGRMKNVTPKAGTRSIDMYDVLERPERYNFKDSRTRAMVDSIRQLIKDMDAQRAEVGLPPLAKTLKIPRSVTEIGEVAIDSTDPHLKRVYQYAAEGRANGVNYTTDIRAVLESHLRAHYDEIIDLQFENMLVEASAGAHPVTILPRDLVPQLVRDQMASATANLEGAKLASKRIQRQLMAEGYTNRVIPDASRAIRAVEGARLRGTLTSIRTEVIGKLRQQRAERRLALLKDLHNAQVTERAALKTYNKVQARYKTALMLAGKERTARASLFGRGGDELIPIKMWRQRFIPLEDYMHLEEGLRRMAGVPEQAHIVSRFFNTLGNAIRYLSAGFDLALPFIHGLPVLGENPRAWAKGTLLHYKAILDPTVQFRYIKDNAATFKELAANGVAIGDPEFFAFLREGGGVSIGALTRYIPKGKEIRSLLQGGGRQSFGRFQSAFNTGLGIYRAELWKALKPSWKGSVEELATSVRNLTGALDSRALGVTRNQRGLESMWLAFSPRLLRSTVALVADLRNPLSPRGQVAFRSLSRLCTAAVGVYTLTGIALGKDWDEIGKGLNPLAGKRFLAHQINGDWIGVGGQVRAIAQFLARSAASVKNPDVWLSMNQMENPLIGAYMMRGAVGMHMFGVAAESVTAGKMNVLPYEDIDNFGDALKQIGTSMLPFTVQGHLEGENWFTSGAAFMGARTQPEKWYEEREALAKKEYGVKGWEYMTPPEMQEFYQKHPDLKKKSEDSIAMAARHGERWALRLREREDEYTQYNGLLESVASADIGEQKEMLKNARFTLAANLAKIDEKYADVVEDLERERKNNPPKTRTDELLQGRNEIFDRYTNAETGQPDSAVAREQMYAELDSWEASLSPEDQKLLDDATGLREVPQWLSDYRGKLRELDPYFKALDGTWSPAYIDGAKLRFLNGNIVNEYVSPGEFVLRKPDELAQEFLTNGLGAWGDLPTSDKKNAPTYAEKYGGSLVNNPALARELAQKFVDMAIAEFYSARAKSAKAWLAKPGRERLAELLIELEIGIGAGTSEWTLQTTAGEGGETESTDGHYRPALPR